METRKWIQVCDDKRGKAHTPKTVFSAILYVCEQQKRKQIKRAKNYRKTTTTICGLSAKNYIHARISYTSANQINSDRCIKLLKFLCIQRESLLATQPATFPHTHNDFHAFKYPNINFYLFSFSLVLSTHTHTWLFSPRCEREIKCSSFTQQI